MSKKQIILDEKLIDDANSILSNLGLDISTACQIFLNKLVMEKGIPFELKCSESAIQEDVKVNMNDVFYLLSLVAEKIGVDLTSQDEEDEEQEKNTKKKKK